MLRPEHRDHMLDAVAPVINEVDQHESRGEGADIQRDIEELIGRKKAHARELPGLIKQVVERKTNGKDGKVQERLPPVAPAALPTREFGYSPDPFTGRKALHAGVDFSQQAGAPVFAAGGGTVASVEKDLLWGNCLRIDHGRGVETFYAHLQDVAVKRGQRVVRGQSVGTMGMTGVATGVHLHFELTVRGAKIDPMNFFLPELRLAVGAGPARPGT